MPGEFDGFEGDPMPADATRYVVVKQVRPGVRVRLSFGMFGQPSPTERAAAAVFAALMQPQGIAAASVTEAGHA